ncbi:MAG: Mrp/NBP35 family ATP-binding protein [Candidatus Thermoplasmatota archaeon]|nr:Mrp/NBP35 family ATP-binding protein [Candidatus Thermoplasmatota archaeon]
MQSDKMQEKKNQEESVKKILDQIKYVIVVLSGKGGVGKSTVSTNLALTLAQQGNKVGLLDADMHGPTIPTMLGLTNMRITHSTDGLKPVKVTENLQVVSMGFLLENQDDAIIWRGPLKMAAIRQLLGDFNWGKLDYLIIDLPPGTGDEPLSIAQIIANITGAIIVTTPQDVALVSVRKSITFVNKLKIPVLGVIENMSGFICPHCKNKLNIFKAGGGKKAADDFNVPFLGSIPLDPTIVEKGDEGTITMMKDTVLTISFATIADNVKKSIIEKEVKT